MRALSNSELIGMWECGCAEDSIERALTILACCTGDSRERLAHLGIGDRDARLLRLHTQMFGPSLDGFAECPACHERLEYTLFTHDLAIEPPEDIPIALMAGDRSMTLRVPDSIDLAEIAECADEVHATRLLAKRCIVDAAELAEDELTDDLIDAIACRIAAADPRTETLIALSCSSCRHEWEVTLDIERFLWSKICAAGKRLVREVHALASVYGWSEAEILAMSPVRRQSYLELICPIC